MIKRLAILGATGHIAKGLIENLPDTYSLQLFSRVGPYHRYESFPTHEYDAVINCIGVGSSLWMDPHGIFTITEKYDNMVIDYIRRHPETIYINFSSGAVYGDIFDGQPADGSINASVNINSMDRSFYGISKLNSEAKHRSLKDLRIIDIRVFSYFSRNIRAGEPSFMSEIVSCIRDRRELTMVSGEFHRDFIHPRDLAAMVSLCIKRGTGNETIDAYSSCWVDRSEILDYCSKSYGLEYRICADDEVLSPTGLKPYYYSLNRDANRLIGYTPRYSSLDSIKDGLKEIFGR